MATPEDTTPTPAAKPWPFVNPAAARLDDLADLSRRMLAALKASEDILALAAQYRAPEQPRAKEVYEQVRATIAAASGEVSSETSPEPGTKAGQFIDIDCALDDLEGVADLLVLMSGARQGGMDISDNVLFALGRVLRSMVHDLRAAELPTAVERRIAA